MQEMQQLLPCDMESLTPEPGLHLHPDKLRGALQAMIDDITADTESIIVGYGLCSMAVIGLRLTTSLRRHLR